MNKKFISIFVIISLLSSSLLGCSAIQTNLSLNKTTVDTNVTKNNSYYYVTVINTLKEKNHIYELSAMIPMIVYSGEEADTLIDPINKEIYQNITSMIEESKKNAYTTFEQYIDSAKANYNIEKENKIDALKNKYKSIMGSDEAKAIAEIISNGMRNTVSDSNVIEEVDVEENDIEENETKESETKESEFEENKTEENTIKSTVEGFTDTEIVIVPELHNKNIIVVEPSKSNITQTTMAINGKPGKRPNIAPAEKASDSDIPRYNSSPKNKKATDSDVANYGNTTKYENNNDKKSKKETDSKVANYENTAKYEKNNEIKNTFNFASVNELPKGRQGFMKQNNFIASKSNTDFSEITLDNFYAELNIIKRMHTPNERKLTRDFIPTSIECSFNVTCLDEDYLSLFIDIAESRMTSATRRYYYNIDLKNKKLIKIADILGENYKETCVNAINQKIDIWTQDKKSSLKDNYNVERFIDDNTSFFINNNHIPVVVMDKNAITTGAVGYPEFEIK